MDSFDLGYSTKNIPIPPKNKYLMTLISKTEHFLKRIRWKAFFHDNENTEEDRKETYGFTTPHTPPQHELLKPFENDMYEMISTIEFSKRKSVFQQKLDEDLKRLRHANKVVVPADKTTNMYLVSNNDYDKLLTENVTTMYKKATDGSREHIDKRSAELVTKLKLEDRVQRSTTTECFITLKDHKENFRNAPKCRLINPAKSELGKVSKKITERIVSDIATKMNLNLWKKTSTVIDWFKVLSKEKKAKFVQFDVVDFYPSITEALLDKALAFAALHTEISDDEISIIKHAKNSLLTNKQGDWEKKTGKFDITMGSYDGAESCELIGLYMLHLLQQIIPAHLIGLYRDDGLAIIPEANGPKLERIRKQITKIFKTEGLRITTETNLHIVDFLDVTLNLDNGNYSPFHKPNNTPRYVHTQSNHPPNIIKEIPKMIERRISDISCNNDEFDKAKGRYEEALSRSGYANSQLKYQDHDDTQPATKKKRRRSRNIIWYNPPYSENVTTNIGQRFFKLLDKHFPRGHQFHKLFNRNSVKLSYSCMPNMGRIIKSINNKTLDNSTKEDNDGTATEVKTCNCRNKASCPLDNNCLQRSLVYEATLSTGNEVFTYLGIAGNTFKERYGGHTSSFRHEDKRSSTELSKKVWALKDNNEDFNVTWKIKKKAPPYRGGAKECSLCLTEKLLIITDTSSNLLNKRTELVSKCRHSNKFLLKKCM